MTVPHHALEIILTRPLTANALGRAARALPLAADHDATRLTALVQAKTAHRAVRRLRHQVGSQLPIDVITTHYPDTDHKVLLNVAFGPAVHAVLTAGARCARQTPERFVELALHRALAEHADQEIAHLDHAVGELLTHTTPAYLLSTVGHALTRLSERPTS
ncbi:hypothetical protein ABZW47_16175 [Streptomyces sp. NPDC004549]|uniref:hypothetical protein n=1 Tax=Streptomyces sp. NPDC004549 TaxID=3154283 RepID=UPI0033AA375E